MICLLYVLCNILFHEIQGTYIGCDIGDIEGTHIGWEDNAAQIEIRPKLLSVLLSHNGQGIFVFL